MDCKGKRQISWFSIRLQGVSYCDAPLSCAENGHWRASFAVQTGVRLFCAPRARIRFGRFCPLSGERDSPAEIQPAAGSGGRCRRNEGRSLGKEPYHGLQKTPDGREIQREEVLRRRLPDELADLAELPMDKHMLHVRPAEVSDRRPRRQFVAVCADF